MTPQPPPPGGYPGQPGWQQTPTPPPPGPPIWQPTPPPGSPPGPPAWNSQPEDHTARNVVIAVIVVALVIILLVAAYAVTRPPAASLPVIIPTASPVATKTPKTTDSPAPTGQATAEITAEPTAEATQETPTSEPATAEPSAEPTAQSPTDEPTAETPTGEPTAAVPTPEGTNIPGVEDQEIILGTPVVLGDPEFPQVSLLVQNISDLVKSYSLKGTFKDGDTITATASGYVSDHLAGTIRTPNLYVDGEIGAADVLTVAIDSMLIEEPSTPEGDVAQQVLFGPPALNPDDFIATIDVEVSNNSDANISSLTVSAGVLRDGQLVGIATGVLSDMAAGQTKTATLYVTGSLEDTDELLLNVDTVLLEQ